MKKNYYRCLSRKYRPKLFKNIKGQKHIIKNIQYSIKNSSIHHAYIITGIRGIGKTTLARIFAKSLNCKQININNNIEPCLKCNSCISVEQNIQEDVIEIDAASNTGIMDIKQIIESCKYKPISHKYKIFIIDEIHMISNSAFNALLKILEEPPHFCKFIMITTEIDKIPLTIISRCQKFSLFRLNHQSILQCILEILKNEDIKIQKEAILMLANISEGSVRDMLSILDQIITINISQSITIENIMNVLGIVNPYITYDLLKYLIYNNIKDALFLIKKLYNFGFSMHSIISELSVLIYNVITYKIENTKVKSIYNFCKEDYYTIVKKSSIITLIRLWQICNEKLYYTNSLYDKMHHIEMFIIKVVYTNFFIHPGDMLEIR